MYCHFHGTNEPKWKAVAAHVDNPETSRAGDDLDKLDLDALEAAFDAPNLYEVPVAPDTPLAHAEHFGPPEHVAAELEAESENPDNVQAVDPSFPDLLGDIDTGENEDATMTNLLQHIRVEQNVAEQYVASVAQPLNTFMEI